MRTRRIVVTRSFLLAVFLTAGALLASSPASASTYDISNTTPSTEATAHAIAGTTNDGICQTFKPTVSTLTGFDLQLAKNPTWGGSTIYLAVNEGGCRSTAEEGTEIVGLIDITSDIPSQTSPGLVQVRFTEVAVTPGTTYYLTIRDANALTSNGDDSRLEFLYSSSDTYSDGVVYYVSNGSPEHTTGSSGDIWFRTVSGTGPDLSLTATASGNHISYSGTVDPTQHSGSDPEAYVDLVNLTTGTAYAKDYVWYDAVSSQTWDCNGTTVVASPPNCSVTGNVTYCGPPTSCTGNATLVSETSGTKALDSATGTFSSANDPNPTNRTYANGIWLVTLHQTHAGTEFTTSQQVTVDVDENDASFGDAWSPPATTSATDTIGTASDLGYTESSSTTFITFGPDGNQSCTTFDIACHFNNAVYTIFNFFPFEQLAQIRFALLNNTGSQTIDLSYSLPQTDRLGGGSFYAGSTTWTLYHSASSTGIIGYLDTADPQVLGYHWWELVEFTLDIALLGIIAVLALNLFDII